MSFEKELLKGLNTMADIIDEPAPADPDDGPFITYMGYFKPGKNAYDEPVCRIVRTYKEGTITTVMYPNGVDEYNSIWDDRDTLDYSHKNQ